MMLADLRRDLRYGARVLIASPVFTAVAVATLALGIGANTAIFSVISAILLRPLPYPDPGRLVMIWETTPEGWFIPVAPANYLDWKERSHVFEDIGLSRDTTYALTGSGEPESISGYRFSENFFRVMGVAPQLGRTFLPEEDLPGASPVVVLSHGIWQRRFGRDPGVLGRPIVLNGTSHTVIGVMPPGFDHPGGTQLWTPLALDPALMSRRDARFLRLVARLKPGVTPLGAREEMAAIARVLETEHPATNAGRGARVVLLRDMQVGDIRPALLALAAAVGCVLLIAAANVSSLLLARAAGRGRELAIRMALGAGRWRVVRQLLTESVLLALTGGLLGLLLALWGAEALLALVPRGIANLNIPHIDRIPVDGPVLAFTLLVSLATGAVLGALPALRATRSAPAISLKDSGPGLTEGSRSRRAGGALVAAEMAIAVVLLVGAVLMLRTFLVLRGQPLGIDPSNVVTAQVFLPGYRYDDAAKRLAFLDGVLDRLSALPGVRAAGATNYLPLSGFWGTVSFVADGLPPPPAGQEPEADDRRATPGYFEAIGMRLVRGRGFTPRDTGGSPQVAIVNETLARRIWGERDPVGSRLNLGDAREPSWWEVVGVAGDVRAFGAGTEVHAEIYRPFAQTSFPLIAFAVRAGDPAALAPAIRSAIREVDPDQPILQLTPMESLAASSLATRRVSAVLIGAFAGVALLIAAIGVYGVTSHAVARRTHELGIRMALGAARRDLLLLVMRQGLRPALAGLAGGLAGAWALTRWLRSLLYGVSPTDLSTYVFVGLLLMAVASLACWVPARRATRVSPMIALRTD